MNWHWVHWEFPHAFVFPSYFIDSRDKIPMIPRTGLTQTNLNNHDDQTLNASVSRRRSLSLNRVDLWSLERYFQIINAHNRVKQQTLRTYNISLWAIICDWKRERATRYLHVSNLFHIQRYLTTDSTSLRRSPKKFNHANSTPPFSHAVLALHFHVSHLVHIIRDFNIFIRAKSVSKQIQPSHLPFLHVLLALHFPVSRRFHVLRDLNISNTALQSLCQTKNKCTFFLPTVLTCFDSTSLPCFTPISYLIIDSHLFYRTHMFCQHLLVHFHERIIALLLFRRLLFPVISICIVYKSLV